MMMGMGVVDWDTDASEEDMVVVPGSGVPTDGLVDVSRRRRRHVTIELSTLNLLRIELRLNLDLSD
jgi:hypothetical protein